MDWEAPKNSRGVKLMFMKDPSIVEKLIPGVTNVQVIAQGGQKLVFSALHAKYGQVVLDFYHI